MWTAGASRERGFTLLELLVGIALLGAVLAAAWAALIIPYRAWMAGRNLADEQHTARLVLEWMSRRLRLAGAGVPAGTSEFFTEADQDAVAFWADVDHDGTVEIHRFCFDPTAGAVREQIGSVSSTSCTLGSSFTSSGQGRTLKVVLLGFGYYDGQERALTPLPLTADQRSTVARVRIVLGLDSNFSRSYESGSDLTFTMDATVRNY